MSLFTLADTPDVCRHPVSVKYETVLSIYYLFDIYLLSIYYLFDIYRVCKKKGDLEKYGHNYSEIHQKGKKLVCFGKFSLYAAG